MSARHARPPKPLRAIFLVPALVGIVMAAGLLSALVGDGVWDAVSWLALSIPIGLVAWHAWPRGALR